MLSLALVDKICRFHRKQKRMKSSAEQNHLKNVITDAITLLVKSGIDYKKNASIDALIGITLDNSDVLLVSINETIARSKEDDNLPQDLSHPKAEKHFDATSTTEESCHNSQALAKRKRKRANPVKVMSEATPPKQPKPFTSDDSFLDQSIPEPAQNNSYDSKDLHHTPNVGGIQVQMENGRSFEGGPTIGGVAVWSSPDLMQNSNSTAALGSSQTV